MLETFLARTQATHGKVVEGQQYIHKEQSQLSLGTSLLLILQVNQGLHKWAPDQDMSKGLQ